MWCLHSRTVCWRVLRVSHQKPRGDMVGVHAAPFLPTDIRGIRACELSLLSAGGRLPTAGESWLGCLPACEGMHCTLLLLQPWARQCQSTVVHRNQLAGQASVGQLHCAGSQCAGGVSRAAAADFRSAIESAVQQGVRHGPLLLSCTHHGVTSSQLGCRPQLGAKLCFFCDSLWRLVELTASTPPCKLWSMSQVHRAAARLPVWFTHSSACRAAGVHVFWVGSVSHMTWCSVVVCCVFACCVRAPCTRLYVCVQGCAPQVTPLSSGANECRPVVIEGSAIWSLWDPFKRESNPIG